MEATGRFSRFRRQAYAQKKTGATAPAFDLMVLRDRGYVDSREGDVARRSTHSAVMTGGANDERELLCERIAKVCGRVAGRETKEAAGLMIMIRRYSPVEM